MKIIKDFPPNIKQIEKILPHIKGYCYCYGDTIYSPDNDAIPDHVVYHEQVHMKQQGNDPERWWNMYLTDLKFRMKMELEAYCIQYKYAKSVIKDRNQLDRFLRQIARDISGEAYGNAISMSDAMFYIKNSC